MLIIDTPAPTDTASTEPPIVVPFSGEIDVASGAAVRSTLQACLDHGHLDVVVDLAGVTFIDAAGLGVLVGAQRRFDRAGGRLRVERPQRCVRRLLEITALDKVLGL